MTGARGTGCVRVFGGVLAVAAAFGSGGSLQAASFAVRSDKPGTVALEFDPRADVTSPGAVATADLRIRANVSASSLHVTFSGRGAVSVRGTPTADTSALAAGAQTSVSVTYAVSNKGSGELRATVAGAGGSASALVYALGSSQEALHGSSGLLDLQVKQLERKHARGEVDDATYEEALRRTEGGGAAERVSTSKSSTSTFSGVVRWTDRAGGTHPVRLAPIYLFRSVGGTIPTDFTTTGLDGSYSLEADRRGGYFVQVLATPPGVVVRGDRGRQYIVSHGHTVGAGTEVTLDLTANNVDDNNTAFGVADALLTAQLYVQQLTGESLPTVTVRFPSPFGTFYAPGSDFISILQLDRFDWDVQLHEFGHHVSHTLDFQRNPGGFHGPFNLSDFLGKETGIPLAFDEGWATYFGTTTQQVMGTASLGVPNVGDTHYSDTEDLDFDYDLETQTGGFGGFPEFVVLSTGEDNEISDQRILWDIFDSADDAGDQGVAFGDAAVFSTLVSTHSATLSEAVAALTAGRTPLEVARIGCILTEHKVAPTPTAPSPGAPITSQPPTFTWSANGGGELFRNNSFTVHYYDATFTRLLFSSAAQSATNFTPTRGQWRTIVGGAGGTVRWFVRGTQLDPPVTGPYTSCARTLVG